jgi:hypothetical protein
LNSVNLIVCSSHRVPAILPPAADLQVASSFFIDFGRKRDWWEQLTDTLIGNQSPVCDRDEGEGGIG